MKLLNKLQIRPVLKAEPKPLNVDYTQYRIGTTPLVNDDGRLFFWVDNPLTRAEKRILHSTELSTTEHTMHIQHVNDSKQWLKENVSELTARFDQVELPISTVIAQVGLRGMYRMAKDQIDKAVDFSVSTLRHDKGQYVKPSDIYGGLSDYTFKAMVTDYYVGMYKEDLEQKIEQVKTLGRYPDEWNPIDVRAVKQNITIRPKLNERFIHVYDDDPHYIRLCASLVAGLETVPVQLTYHGGSERYMQGVWSPNCILSMYASSLMESHDEKVLA